eukprot:105412_1
MGNKTSVTSKKDEAAFLYLDIDVSSPSTSEFGFDISSSDEPHLGAEYEYHENKDESEYVYHEKSMNYDMLMQLYHNSTLELPNISHETFDSQRDLMILKGIEAIRKHKMYRTEKSAFKRKYELFKLSKTTALATKKWHFHLLLLDATEYEIIVTNTKGWRKSTASIKKALIHIYKQNQDKWHAYEYAFDQLFVDDMHAMIGDTFTEVYQNLILKKPKITLKKITCDFKKRTL